MNRISKWLVVAAVILGFGGLSGVQGAEDPVVAAKMEKVIRADYTVKTATLFAQKRPDPLQVCMAILQYREQFTASIAPTMADLPLDFKLAYVRHMTALSELEGLVVQMGDEKAFRSYMNEKYAIGLVAVAGKSNLLADADAALRDEFTAAFNGIYNSWRSVRTVAEQYGCKCDIQDATMKKEFDLASQKKQ